MQSTQSVSGCVTIASPSTAIWNSVCSMPAFSRHAISSSSIGLEAFEMSQLAAFGVHRWQLSVSPRTAYFVALYAELPGMEMRPNSDEMLTR